MQSDNPWKCRICNKKSRTKYCSQNCLEIGKISTSNNNRRKLWKLSSTLKLSEFEKGWLSGLIDGEGTLTIHYIKRNNKKGWKLSDTYSTHVSISNTNLILLKKVQEVCRGGTIFMLSRNLKIKYSNHNWKDSYVYNMPLYVQRIVLPQLKLIVKEKQYDVFKQLWSIKDNYCKFKYSNKSSIGDRVGGKIRPNIITKKLGKLKEDINILNKRGRC